VEQKDKFRGDAFPDLDKAKKAKPITDLVAKLLKEDTEIYQIAEDEKISRRNQLKHDFCSFELSQKSALDSGNANACADKAQFENIAKQQAKSKVKVEKAVKLPGSNTLKPYGKGKKQTKLPKQRSAGAIQGGVRANRNRPLSKTNFNIGSQGLVVKSIHYITPIKPSNQAEKAASNYKNFITSQAGKRGTAVGDRAIVFSGNGTPHYGDSYLDKSLQENLSANQATATPAVTTIPKQIKETKAIDADKLNRTKNGQIHPKGDSMGNMIALGVVAAAVTAVMFAIQYVIGLVSFILQVQTLTSTVTNISASFITIFNNIGTLLGLGKNVLKPIEETFDGMLNNAFGKENISYVKLQFAKINTAFTAGTNILQKIGSTSTNMSNAIEQGANNTSRVGNALKSAGIIGDGITWMNEQITARSGAKGKIGDVTNALSNVGTLTDDLSAIVADVNTAKEEIEKLNKDAEAKEKEKLEGEEKAVETHTDEEVPIIPAIRSGDV
jgi:hypothetical protein